MSKYSCDPYVCHQGFRKGHTREMCGATEHNEKSPKEGHQPHKVATREVLFPQNTQRTLGFVGLKTFCNSFSLFEV